MRKALFVLALSAPQIFAQKPSADLILINGTIFTSVAAHPYVAAVAIRGERIVAVGDTKTIQALAGPHTNTIDLHGATAIPGINDAHHYFNLGPPEVDVHLATPDPSWEQAEQALTKTIAANPPGSFIVVTICTSVFGDASIDRDALDRLAPSNPVALETFTGHAAVLNSAALRSLKIPEEQPDPLGGRFERDAKGRLTGTIREYAWMNVERAAADRIPDNEAVEQIRHQLDAEARYGVTSIQELSMAMAPARAIAILEKVPTHIRVRIVRMPGTTPAGRNIEEGQGVPAHPASMITVSGSKWLGDGVGIEGTLTPRSQWKIPSQPPLDVLLTATPLMFSRAEYVKMLDEAGERNEQLLIHVSGNQSTRVILEAIDQAGGASVWRPHRIRFEHGDGLLPDEFPQTRQDGIIVVQNPIHFAPIMPPGVVPFEKAQPLKSLLDAGIPLALGSDGSTNPYLDIMLAEHPGNRPSEGITREQAVTAYTLTSAYAEFQEKEKGSIEPGELADIAVLTQDIFTVPASELPKTQASLTLVGGKIVYQAGK